MKKAKRITAAILAAAIMMTAVPAGAGAIYTPFNEKYLEGFIRLEKGQFDYLDEFYTINGADVPQVYLDGIELYVSSTGQQLIQVRPGSIYLSFMLGGNSSIGDATAVLERYVSPGDYRIAQKLVYDGVTYYDPVTDGYHISIYDTSVSTAEMKRAFAELKEKGIVTEMTEKAYGGDISRWYRTSPLGRDFLAFYEEEKSLVSDYLTEKGIAFTIEEIPLPEDSPYSPAVQFIPETEMTQLEKMALFGDILRECNLKERSSFSYYEWESPAIDMENSTAEIDVYDFTDGDANCDDKLTVSDAVAVLQYIANAEKYPLTDQGKFNADADGEEGITGGDAIAIQKKDAGIWDES